MADGTPFDMDKTYKVALSSYRGNGGGEHLTKGVGLDSKGIADRIIYRSKTDLRSIIADRIRKKGRITPRTLDTWKFIPEDVARKAAEKDARLLR